MPWRSIETVVEPSTSAPAPPGGVRPSRALIATVGIAGLLAVVAFVVALGSGGPGSFTVVGGEMIGGSPPVDAAGPVGSGAIGADAPPELVLEVVGAVERPGVYHLPAGSRVGDLVDAAGGYSPRVDTARATRSLNLAARLADGDQVRVPSRDDADVPDLPAATGPGGPSANGSAPMDLNHATTEQLDTLPGIGPATAAKILAAREETPFASVDDLRTRKLVGAKTFEGLRELVTVR
jgi:competence protein ComEA